MSLLIYSTGQNHIKEPLVGKSVNGKAIIAGTDTLLLRRIVRRDESAVGELYERHASYLFTLMLRIVKNQTEAEDALQELFLRVWERAESYDESLGSPSVWMTRIARNLAIDRLRSKLGQARRAEEDLDGHGDLHAEEHSSSPEHFAARAQQKAHVVQALENLPVEQRMLIEFAYFQGYTQ